MSDTDRSRQKWSRIERLLNYKRYIDWMIEQELQRANKQNKEKK